MTEDTTIRHDGWTPARQRAFLETLAAEGVVKTACAAAGLSREAAYGFRQRTSGAAFALGWDAAVLIARTRLIDTLMERALEGQRDVTTYDSETHTRERDWHDNRLAMSLLGRLDRRADDKDAPGTEARLIGGDWEAFLDLISDGHGGAGAALFLAARRPEPVPDGQCQLRPGNRGKDDEDDADTLTVAEELEDMMGVWEDDGEYLTDFPPPPDFDGDETGTFGEWRYSRSLTGAEETLWRAYEIAQVKPALDRAHARREAFFAECREVVAAAGGSDATAMPSTDFPEPVEGPSSSRAQGRAQEGGFDKLSQAGMG